MSRVYVLVFTAAVFLLALQVMLRLARLRGRWYLSSLVALLHRLCFCRLGVTT